MVDLKLPIRGAPALLSLGLTLTGSPRRCAAAPLISYKKGASPSAERLPLFYPVLVSFCFISATIAFSSASALGSLFSQLNSASLRPK